MRGDLLVRELLQVTQLVREGVNYLFFCHPLHALGIGLALTASHNLRAVEDLAFARQTTLTCARVRASEC